MISPVVLCPDLLEQRVRGSDVKDQRDAVWWQTWLGAPSGGGKTHMCTLNRVQVRESNDELLTYLVALQMKKVRSLILAGAVEYEGFPQQLRLLEAPLKLSAKDLRSQVVRETCITLG